MAKKDSGRRQNLNEQKILTNILQQHPFVYGRSVEDGSEMKRFSFSYVENYGYSEHEIFVGLIRVVIGDRVSLSQIGMPGFGVVASAVMENGLRRAMTLSFPEIFESDLTSTDCEGGYRESLRDFINDLKLPMLGRIIEVTPGNIIGGGIFDSVSRMGMPPQFNMPATGGRFFGGMPLR